MDDKRTIDNEIHIPESERWLQEPKVKTELDRALA
jgi:hypothetical protein